MWPLTQGRQSPLCPGLRSPTTLWGESEIREQRAFWGSPSTSSLASGPDPPTTGVQQDPCLCKQPTANAGGITVSSRCLEVRPPCRRSEGHRAGPGKARAETNLSLLLAQLCGRDRAGGLPTPSGALFPSCRSQTFSPKSGKLLGSGGENPNLRSTAFAGCALWALVGYDLGEAAPRGL